MTLEIRQTAALLIHTLIQSLSWPTMVEICPNKSFVLYGLFDNKFFWALANNLTTQPKLYMTYYSMTPRNDSNCCQIDSNQGWSLSSRTFWSPWPLRQQVFSVSTKMIWPTSGCVLQFLPNFLQREDTPERKKKTFFTCDKSREPLDR